MSADPPALLAFRSAPSKAFVFDFDGTLSDIVARPEMARAADGAREALSRLASTHRLVAVVSGRPVEQLRDLIGVPGVILVGLYGMKGRESERAPVQAAVADVRRVADRVQGAWVEDKGPSLAVHYRQARDRRAAEMTLLPALSRIAQARGLSLLPGKMVLEVAAGEVPGKGAVVRDLVKSAGVSGCLYAGDDVADHSAFEALDGLQGVACVKVAVRSEGTPASLVAGADLVVEGPAGLVRLLRDL